MRKSNSDYSCKKEAKSKTIIGRQRAKKGHYLRQRRSLKRTVEDNAILSNYTISQHQLINPQLIFLANK